ncbi:MAG: hypothetical protein CL858_05215 [Cupriavidus sp.]|jgi:hypothetical protein|uniref:hypothetical protein n=1 Tax=Cupriavidus basilensis TaxID=68895 RepID=UPI0004B82840|nr:hypothetical protein [Cupriavidus basilensis]MBU64846.1 hypothetical protein [Cupriavidus sp.]MDF3882816.1 hypothetical protein [Cupriavidus basilensis]
MTSARTDLREECARPLVRSDDSHGQTSFAAGDEITLGSDVWKAGFSAVAGKGAATKVKSIAEQRAAQIEAATR